MTELEQLKANYKELERQLKQEKIWKEEDPRMLREQIRVADIAYNYLHSEHKKLQIECEQAQKNFSIQRDNYIRLYEAVMNCENMVAELIDPVELVKQLWSENAEMKKLLTYEKD